ncbi:putative Transferase [Quillaja saponaria]|uniref:Transferase n=1 Tax=Quillaja saponaria TaxID=32244 RepID=A0AAD7L890_QUISA|nr:putative Transferase [Quillaja saponaria]
MLRPNFHNNKMASTSTLQIEAAQSVTPLKIIEPRQVRQVRVTEPIKPGILNGRHHIVLYYNKLSDEDSGWILAGWIKESLSTALLEQPILAGRIRRKKDDDNGLVIVANDSGIRLIETRIAMTLFEFLKLKHEKVDVEAELVFWKDIDEQNPEFSPLFYVQVTNFQCGGYSIGISCSLLLADLFIMDKFLNKWANIHRNIVSKNDLSEKPIFYTPNLSKSGSSLIPQLISSTPCKNGGQSMIFNITDSGNLCMELALLCVQEAEQKLGVKMGSDFSLFTKESSDVIKVENWSRIEHDKQPLAKLECEITSANWNDCGVYDVAFCEGNKPASISNWIDSISDGLVLAISSSKDGIYYGKVIVTLPNGKVH